ncbi:hypothetical protein M8C21_021114 [Ambrosia artemisiifolia]|uniref:Serine hydroxymethyltransferase n=1 Tax=Ambrosia artemisiifolia TaxID=4212 RepID=A0AAD5GIA7_AMBAR|nr:hypothetical protein M8C21_021114 [Ambrosia artemisiifolia]
MDLNKESKIGDEEDEEFRILGHSMCLKRRRDKDRDSIDSASSHTQSKRCQTLESRRQVVRAWGNQSLQEADPDIFELLDKEKRRQYKGIELIASENFVCKAVLEALGSHVANKYSEGMPGARYYAGNQYIDEIEMLCRERALEAFGLDSESWGVNVQPYSCTSANFAVYTGLLLPGDRIMGLDTPSGGNTSHGYYTPNGMKVSGASIFFESLSYKVNPKTGIIDFEKLEERAVDYRPKILICGGSSYPREWDYSKFRQITDKCGAVLMCDMAQISGLIAAKECASPFEFCDIVTSTTHKSLRGPRGGIIFYRKGPKSRKSGMLPSQGDGNDKYDFEEKINFAVCSALQGGPHNNHIAALAIALKQLATPEYQEYMQQLGINGVVWNKLKPSHLPLRKNLEKVCEMCHITVNKTAIFDDNGTLVPGGVRIGTPAMTSRGCLESDFETMADFLCRAAQITSSVQREHGKMVKSFLKGVENNKDIIELRTQVENFATQFSMPGQDLYLPPLGHKNNLELIDMSPDPTRHQQPNTALGRSRVQDTVETMDLNKESKIGDEEDEEFRILGHSMCLKRRRDKDRDSIDSASSHTQSKRCQTLESRRQVVRAWGNQSLQEADPDIFELLDKEKKRQYKGIELIASENFVCKAVLEALGSHVANKYSEGMPGARYYAGNQYIDEVEMLCRERALEAFGLDSESWGVNVQPYSCTSANFAVYTGLLLPGDRIMGLDTPSGGNTSHGYYTPNGMKVSGASIFFESLSYKVNPKTGIIDFEKLEERAVDYRPKILICGGSSYPREWDYLKFRQIADKCGAVLMCDMAQISGLIAAKECASPFEFCDIVTSTTHKSLRGPRGGIIFYRKGPKSRKSGMLPSQGDGNDKYDFEEKINFAVCSALQGGPHNNHIAALAIALKQLATPEYQEYMQQLGINGVVWNKLKPSHLALRKNLEKVCEMCHITVNKTAIFDDNGTLVPGGVRIGTPAMTSRGCLESDFETMADFLCRAAQITSSVQREHGKMVKSFLKGVEHNKDIIELRTQVENFATQFSMPGQDL